MNGRLKTLADLIAPICHEANKAWCEANGDYTQKPWDIASEWQRESAVKGVQFKLDNPETAPKDQHNSWKKHKLEDGWIFGKKKDERLKTHPCIVAYEELPKTQQKKDALFQAIVNALK
ncbi:MAG TPA: hypothetical protein ENI23_01245 [bacterium]|nr:hypothetical protein [bacterium]